jgi:hypothetical protein
MNSIKSILYSVAVIGVFSGLFELLSSTSKYQKYIKYAASLLVVIALLSPIQHLFDLLKDNEFSDDKLYPEYEYEHNDYIQEVICNAIKDDLCKKYVLPADSLAVSIVIKDSVIESIDIIIKDQTYFRYAERLEAYMNTSYGCKIKVIQEFESS